MIRKLVSFLSDPRPVRLAWVAFRNSLPSVVAFLYPLAQYVCGPQLSDPRRPYIERAFRAVAACGIQGDYLEFGSFYGHTFTMAYMLTRKHQLKNIRLFAFDSWEGFPYSEGPYQKGRLDCSREVFCRFIRSHGVDTRRVVAIEGVFSESLTEAVKERNNLEKAAIVHIDSDLYLSAKDALRFVEDLVHPGSILIFDDWRDFDHLVGIEAAVDFGEQKAFLEWSLRDKFEEFYQFNSTKAFIMT